MAYKDTLYEQVFSPKLFLIGRASFTGKGRDLKGPNDVGARNKDLLQLTASKWEMSQPPRPGVPTLDPVGTLPNFSS